MEARLAIPTAPHLHAHDLQDKVRRSFEEMVHKDPSNGTTIIDIQHVVSYGQDAPIPDGMMLGDMDLSAARHLVLHIFSAEVTH